MLDQLVETYFLENETFLGEDMSLHLFRTIFQRRILGNKTPMVGIPYVRGTTFPLHHGTSSSIKGGNEMWFLMREKWQVCEGVADPHVTIPTSYTKAREFTF